ncbi:MAG TPA: hypothetical protein VHZ03_02245, partial [Trebonia sp.]|nr:hypothetical protein [Trebonia sp.]
SELRARRAAPGPRRHVGWRAPVATVLIVAGCLLAPISVLGVWTANQVSDTGRYVANVEPLVHDPAIQNALTDKITNEITAQVNVTGYTKQAAAALTSKGLPRAGTLLNSFAPQISSAFTGFVHGQVRKIVTGPRFARLWVQANTRIHAQLVKVLSGQGSTSVTISNGQVVLNLGPFITLVKQDLAQRGLGIVSKLPAINPAFTLFSAKYLVKAQTGYRLINDLKIVLPIVALLLLGAGVYVARRHRRALIGAGLGVATSMLVLAAGLLIFRSIYLSSIPASVPADAAAVLFDTFVRFIKDGLRLLLVIGLVIAAGAFLTGPSVTAARTRGAFTAGFGWLRHSAEHLGIRTGPAGTWTYAHRRALRIAAVALAALIFVFWGEPSAAAVIVIVILLLAVLGLIELIGARPPTPPQPPGPPAPPASPAQTGMAGSL